MAEGDIGAIINSYEFHETDIENPSLIHISGNVFAVVYSDADYDGHLKTFEIAVDGTITEPFIDSYEFEPSSCFAPSIIHVSGNVFAIVFQGVSVKGRISTITIADDGTITKSIISSYTLTSLVGYRTDIIHIGGNVFAVAYTGYFNDGFVDTITIAENGTIIQETLDSFEFAPTDGLFCKILNVTNDIYAIVYIDGNRDCCIATMSINWAGAISDAVLDQYTFNAGTNQWTNFIQVSTNVFAVVYSDVNNDGWITTIEIADNGTITKTIVDTYCFDAGKGTDPCIIHISGDVYAIAYNGGAAGGSIRTIEINAAGEITEPYLSNGNYDLTTGEQSSFLFIAGSIYVVAYRGAAADGFISTVTIETLVAGGAQHLMIMGVG